MTACGNNQQQLVIGDPEFTGEQSFIEVNEPATPNCPAYVVINNPEVELSAFPVDKDGYHVIFNGNEKIWKRPYTFKMGCRGRLHQVLWHRYG